LKYSTLFVGVLSVSLLGGCKSEPCGKGFSVDERPLPEAWQKFMPAFPEGATACYNAKSPRGDTAPTYERSLSFPEKSPADSIKALHKHFSANGWRPTLISPQEVKDREGLVWWGFPKGSKSQKLEIWCSASVDKGMVPLVSYYGRTQEVVSL